ncbi:MAG: site-specific DNA-methyltransferase [Dehalococcoidales bacterium]|nr:site-specific DNA-methyltransferase [Dehalococcoidales bacterium]
MDTNVLYYGDNLEILRKYIPDSSVDLIYLDPPFNSKATYNVLFKEPSGESSQAQISAFEDSWHWGLESERALQEIAASPVASAEVKEFMSVLPKLVGKRTDMAAYLTMMCIRLIELRRVLKDTGSIYLHCDPTASHYLKLLMDTIFGVANFRNEIIWRRSFAHGDTGQGAKHFGRVTDTILFYAKSNASKWNSQYTHYSEEALKRDYKYVEPQTKRQYRLAPVDGPGGVSKGNPYYEFMGVSGYWRFSKDKMHELYDKGRIVVSSTGKSLSQKLYLDEAKGTPIINLWDDINRISPTSKERLGYPTQKPETLLERIIKASSNEDDIVLDPFCGCGTATVAAQRLNRKWIGIDITHLAIGLMKWRLKNMTPMPSFKVVGEPKDLAGAIELADQNKYQFQWWAVHTVGGQPYGDKKKGADTGIDGYLYYMDEKDKIKKAIISVKGGKNANVSMIRDLGHVIDREKSDIGVFILLEKPTRPMVEEAAMKGFYHSPLGKDYPRLQILTIEEILNGKMPDIPPWIAPITAPAPVKKAEGKTTRML